MNATRPWIDRWRSRHVLAPWLFILAVFWGSLRLLGREWLSDSGFGVWTGAQTLHTSQWMADPYTFTHVLHGVLFYWMLLPFRRRWTLEHRFLAATLIEAAWEILENTPLVIERYRNNTMSLDYYGDSILNATCDLFAALFGFGLAARFSWKLVLLMAVIVELALAYWVRDNLTLNVLMFLCPLDSLKQWQMGG